MRLAGAVTQGSGVYNEDGLGFLGTETDITAAWVFDGVTGINHKNLAAPGTDAQWIVGRAHHHLTELAASSQPLQSILDQLVDRLIIDWSKIISNHAPPEDFDPPAACLILAKRYGNGWQALRLGDSVLLTQTAGQGITVFAPDTEYDHWLSNAASQRRAAGFADHKALHDEFRTELFRRRQTRNTPGGYSILEAVPAATQFAELIDLGQPEKILLCTDGFYRAVDHYAIFTPKTLLDAASTGIPAVLTQIRATEFADPGCNKYPRLKPADDATALCLVT